MIRLMHEADRPGAAALLRQAPAFNLYALGNLETLGVDSEFCQFWGDFDETGRVRAVLNRYMNGWVIYGHAEAAWADLAAVIDNHPIQAERMQDNPGGIVSFLPYLRRYRARRVEVETLMVLDGEAFRAQPIRVEAEIRRAVDTDLDRLIAFYADAEEMRRTALAVQRPLRNGRIWIAELAGQIEAAALTNAETAGLAMIGGVFSRPQARGRGLGQAVVGALCADLLGAGLQPALYWINPIAGAIYRKLGFRAVGEWRAVRLERTNEAE